MAFFRFVLVVLILGGLTLFTLQNWSPMQLVFLGIKLQSLPFAIWVLTAFAVGFLTALAVAWLFQLYEYVSVGNLRSRIRQLELEKTASPPPRPQTPPVTGSYSYSSSYAPASSPTASTAASDDREWEDDGQDSVDNSSKESDFTDRDYETKQEPTTSYRSGSVYSYSYKNPSTSGSSDNKPKSSSVGKTDSVYDADYRVINPPLRDLSAEENEIPKKDKNWESKPKNSVEDDDDWGFDDDDFDDDDFDNRSRRR